MELPQYKKDFIHFLVKSNALKFGEFTLKSGRVSPYFINAGMFASGDAISQLGNYYASALVKNKIDFDTVFGPAYKGIPFAVATAASLYREHGKNVSYAFNRKEVKDHGEGGFLIGATINANSKVVIIDDVITAGTAMRESVELFRRLGNPKISAIIILVDRMEKGSGNMSAVQDLEKELGIKVYSIANIAEIMEYLHNRKIDRQIILDDEKYEAVKRYLEKYGA